METPKSSQIIDRLVADLRPVRVLRIGHLMVGWVLAQAIFLVVACAMRHRPDLAEALTKRLALADLTLSVVVGTYAGWLAARSAFPDRLPTRGELGVAVGGGLLVFVMYLLASQDAPTPVMVFVRNGVGCFVMTFALAMMPWGGLLWILWRGATLRPAQAGAIAGAASLLLAAAGMRTMCVIDERLHLAVWHALPVALGAYASAGLTLVLFRWRKRRRDAELREMLRAG